MRYLAFLNARVRPWRLPLVAAVCVVWVVGTVWRFVAVAGMLVANQALQLANWLTGELADYE